ncbi:thiamin pyrophosphokinase 1 isoform X2 [Zea mays]|uniref:Thiamine pyrophosphokinase n=3 Tax=Zea mays TaxID=4577 RepID=C0P2Y2_MAIZE|nr:thiamin pyrophosphokinase 1 [Zea mays]XP_035821818.1 thiamin pyrophosphokinase 1 isoform X2 [Zea mays]XP_035821819.1 thiamin pyrophosphokinase 1 isoform X2 [Zea mays]XP_035821820.1 thiamin pyrophosphokinase 1 isoform X2 [Zea mays]ACN27348.1 unknown [Zea mays]|eukprot:NP_001152100.1 thiamin pyrophosphokinase 1 [Zea mays]
MLWRAVRSMDVIMHSSSFLLPKLYQPVNKPVKNYALVVLNQHLPRFMPRLWDHANLRICADGGANHIFDEMYQITNDEDKKSTRNKYVPEIIEGDMDSIRPEVKLFYSSQGSKISDKSHNQETTDLHKCISRIHHCTPDDEKPNLCVLVTGALGGRFDHEAANINVLYLFSDMRIVLLSDDCLIRLLPRTHRHELYIESSVEGPHCGLFPVGAPSTSTTTTGLKWNLSESKMRFGSMISTSNIVQSEKVTVESDADLLWTISLRNLT